MAETIPENPRAGEAYARHRTDDDGNPYWELFRPSAIAGNPEYCGALHDEADAHLLVHAKRMRADLGRIAMLAGFKSAETAFLQSHLNGIGLIAQELLTAFKEQSDADQNDSGKPQT